MLDKFRSIEAAGLVLFALIGALAALLWSSKGAHVYMEVLAAGFASCF